MNQITKLALDNEIVPNELIIFLEEKLNKKISDITTEEITSLQNEWMRLKDEQLQYVLQKAWFFGEEFYVTPDVLIPRFDTEFVLDTTLNNITRSPQKILDLCTGSGILAITLKKKFPDAKVYASDISEKALEVAKRNAKMHNVDIEFINSDLFANINDIKFDLIISNPPYLSIDEEVHWKTLKHEPNIALFAENNGLKIYERISLEIAEYLSDNGLISLEIGDGQADQLRKYFSKYNIIGVFHDYNNRERNIIFKRNC